ncbi:MAG: AbrB/MazE/SpoVT family DNA-binding domain-containing protein [archaeon]|nr:AbrB/MazE/SpoVT family DNA-binding domain-containing protein [archaeon]MCP8313928.1 AbrB/MazE/SpoVT family DNA-binding domain-containing protein [archaeon]
MPVEFKMKLIKIGNSLRVTIPKEIIEAVNLKKGDVLSVSLSNDSKILIKKAEGS